MENKTRQKPKTENGDRLPPHSLEAERAVLGCGLNDVGALDWLGANVRGEMFYDLRHRLLYENMLAMHNRGEPVDAMTLAGRMAVSDQAEKVGGLAFIAGVSEAVVSASQVEYWGKLVRELASLRGLIRVCAEGARAAMGWAPEQGAGEIRNQVETELLALDEGTATGRVVTAAEGIREVMEKLEVYRQGVGVNSGLMTGYDYLDKMLCGLHPADLMVVAGRPGTGKTSFMMNVVEHLVLRRVPVHVFSLEMTAEQLFSRLVFQVSLGNYQHYRTGMLDKHDLPGLLAAGDRLKAAPLYVDDQPGLTINDVRARARRLHRLHGTQLVAVDYLQLLKSTKPMQNREQEVSEMSSGLKALAKELKIPVICLAQLNRDIEKADAFRKPKLSDLRESGSVEQDADVVMIFYLPKLSDEEKEMVKNADWSERWQRVNGNVAKQRNGPSGDVTFLFRKKSMRFESYNRTDGVAAAPATAATGERGEDDLELPTNEELGL